jgi:hypothetical protein
MATPVTVSGIIDVSAPLTTVTSVPIVKMVATKIDVGFGTGGGGGGSTRPTSGFLYPRGLG